MIKTKSNWTVEIKPKSKLIDFNLAEVWKYRDLIRMFVFRDFVTFYKQTILGPLWFFIQPIFQATINLFVFGKLAGIGPEGVPGFLFYLSGPIVWQYFQECFTKTAGTFTANQNIFGKVSFPRLILPISIILSNLMKFAVQLLILLIAIAYYYFKTGEFFIQREIWIFPILMMILMFMSLGFGLIVTSLTSKYRDLKFLVDFGVPLLKYLTPGIATSMAIFKESLPENLRWVAVYNPMGYILDSFNYIFTGAGEINIQGLLFTTLFTAFLTIFGMLIFNRTEKTFMDTV